MKLVILKNALTKLLL